MIIVPSIRRVGRFLTAGILNTAFGYVLFVAFRRGGLSNELALFLSTLCGVVFNFVTFGVHVFDNLSPRLFPRFLLVYGGVYFLNLALLKALILCLHLNAAAAQALSLPLVVTSTYILLRQFVFNRKSEAVRGAQEN